MVGRRAGTAPRRWIYVPSPRRGESEASALPALPGTVCKWRIMQPQALRGRHSWASGSLGGQSIRALEE